MAARRGIAASAGYIASRLDDELDASKSFATFVGLVGAFARKRAE